MRRYEHTSVDHPRMSLFYDKVADAHVPRLNEDLWGILAVTSWSHLKICEVGIVSLHFLSKVNASCSDEFQGSPTLSFGPCYAISLLSASCQVIRVLRCPAERLRRRNARRPLDQGRRRSVDSNRVASRLRCNFKPTRAPLGLHCRSLFMACSSQVSRQPSISKSEVNAGCFTNADAMEHADSMRQGSGMAHGFKAKPSLESVSPMRPQCAQASSLPTGHSPTPRAVHAWLPW